MSNHQLNSLRWFMQLPPKIRERFIIVERYPLILNVENDTIGGLFENDERGPI